MTTRLLGREILQRFREHRRLGVATALVFALSAFLVGMGILGVKASKRWSGLFAQDVHVIVYLSEEMDSARTRGLAELLARLPQVDTVQTVDPSEARARLAASAARLGNPGFDTVDASIFPHSIEVSFLPSANLGAQIADLAKRLRPVPGVLFVDDMSEGMGQLTGWMRLGKRVGIAILVAAGLLVVIFPLLALLRFRRAQAPRSAVLFQLGATPFDIRVPAAVMLGTSVAVGGSLALLALALFARPLLGRIEANLGLSLPQAPALSSSLMLSVIALPAAIGLLAGYLLPPIRRDHA